jgi:hypothetical protein
MKLANDYPEPLDLILTAFSDKDMIRRKLSHEGRHFDPVFPNTPDGEEAKRRYYDKYYPLSTGYYRAMYSRIQNRGQEYSYSPDPNKVEMTTVVLGRTP